MSERTAAGAKDSPYERGLERTAANYTALSPLSFIERAAAVFPDKTAVIHGARRYSYREFLTRCRRLASALAGRGVRPGDTVAMMAPNVPALLEAHYGVAMAGAVLNALNYRLDAATHRLHPRPWRGQAADRGPRVLRDGRAPRSRARRSTRSSSTSTIRSMRAGEPPRRDRLRGLLCEGDPDFACRRPADEWQAISLSYTSGTTGNPKGVVYHHRGAYLNALGNIMAIRPRPPHRSISGPCRCFIATAGASPGR